MLALLALGALGGVGWWMLGGNSLLRAADAQRIAARQVDLSWEKLDFAGHTYPVIYEDEYVALPGSVDVITTFAPVFSPKRAVVNPSAPRLAEEQGRTVLSFDRPGEYYLDIDGALDLKVLVLERGAGLSANVVRTFDFLVANLVVTQGNDREFYDEAEGFAADFFSSDAPRMLLCGPTLSFFEMLLRDRFDLPTRDVTFTGVTLQDGQLRYSTHNVVEVFLPDLAKWVMFDVNNGFYARWLDAFELTEKIRAASSSASDLSKVDFDAIHLDTPYAVDALATRNPADLRSLFSPSLLSRHSVRDNWHALFRMIFSGPAYWGGPRFGRAGLPAEHDLYSSTYHQDPFLLTAQLRWQSHWPLKIRQVAPQDLKSMLELAYAPEIEQRRWLAKMGSAGVAGAPR